MCMDQRLRNPPSVTDFQFKLSSYFKSSISWFVNILSQQKVGVYKIYK